MSSAVLSIEQKAAPLLDVDPTIRKVLPQVFVDGPFGGVSESVFDFEVAILVGVGTGVTPFASVLKSIWYRMNNPRQSTCLNKVYFFWICHDFETFEWFRSLLMAIEFQDMDSHIEIYPVWCPYHNLFPAGSTVLMCLSTSPRQLTTPMPPR